MGIFRCLSKPIKRWSFEQGEQFTWLAVEYFTRKYILKYLRKRNKTAMSLYGDVEFDDELLVTLAAKITNLLMTKKIKKQELKIEAEDVVEVIKAVLKAALTPSSSHMNLSKLAEDALEVGGEIPLSTSMSTAVNSRSPTPPPTPPSSTRSSGTSLMARSYSGNDLNSVDGKNEDFASFNSVAMQIALYCIGLKAAADTNVGLEHGKVSEYWLSRGPRQFFTMVLFIIVSVILAEYLKPPSYGERSYTYLSGTAGIIAAFIMLYYRLPDAINASVHRSCHDFYCKQKVDVKKTLNLRKSGKKRPTQLEVMEVPKVQEEDEGMKKE